MRESSLRVRIKTALNTIMSHAIMLTDNDIMMLYNHLEKERIKRIQLLQKSELEKIKKVEIT